MTEPEALRLLGQGREIDRAFEFLVNRHCDCGPGLSSDCSCGFAFDFRVISALICAAGSQAG